MGQAAPPADVALRVRPAEWGDASDVANLLDQLGYPCTRDEAADRIDVILHDPRQHLLLAEIEGHACGLISTYTRYSLTHGDHIAQITALVIDGEYRRLGVGKRLLREIEALARRSGVKRIEVNSNASRLEGHAFYRDCGFNDGSLRFVKLLGD